MRDLGSRCTKYSPGNHERKFANYIRDDKVFRRKVGHAKKARTGMFAREQLPKPVKSYRRDCIAEPQLYKPQLLYHLSWQRNTGISSTDPVRVCDQVIAWRVPGAGRDPDTDGYNSSPEPQQFDLPPLGNLCSDAQRVSILPRFQPGARQSLRGSSMDGYSAMIRFIQLGRIGLSTVP